MLLDKCCRRALALAPLLFLLPLLGVAQAPECSGTVQYTVTLGGGSYADERGYKIVAPNGTVVYQTGEQGGPTSQGGTGCVVSANAAATALVALNAGTTYTIIGYDCYGDGWNGGQVRIRRSSDNLYVLGTAATGVTFTTSSCTGGCYQQVGGGTARWNFTTLAFANCGCTNPASCNYNPAALYDDGSCPITGCMTTTACNYNSCATVAGTCDFTSCVDCLDPLASNYGPAGTQAGTCTYCDIQQPSYCYPNNLPANNVLFSYSSPGTPITVSFNQGTIESFSWDKLRIYKSTDLTPANLIWQNGTSTTNLAGLEFHSQTGVIVATLQTDGSVSCASGSYGPMQWAVSWDCNAIGCTDALSCNYDPAATWNDGSCDYSCIGCMDVTAANYDPSATLQGAQSCVYCEPNTYVVQIGMTDANGGGWAGAQYTISDLTTGTTYSGDFETANVVAGTNATDLYCLALGCYTFTVAGGSAANLAAAGYTVTDQFGTDYLAGSGAASEEPLDFGLTGTCNFGGCTDPFCFNFNISATVDDGSCICPPANSFVDTAEGINCGLAVSGNLVNAFDAEGIVGQGVGGTLTVPVVVQTGGVWYEYNAAADGQVIADLCGTGAAGFASPVLNGRLHVYTQNADGSLNLIAGNDNSCGNQPRIAWLAETGENYYVYVSKTINTVGTDFLLSLNCTDCDDVAVGASCEEATPQINGVTFEGTTCCQAPISFGSYTGGGGATNYGTWFTFNSSDYDTFDFDATNISNANLTLTIYLAGGDCETISSYVGCIFTGTCAGSIESFITLTPNTNYYFLVGTTDPLGCGEFEFTTSGVYLGCTDTEADNYDQQATQDDGTCTYSVAPENDLCADAITLDCNVGFVDGSLGGATEDAESQACGDPVLPSEPCLGAVYGQYPSATFTPTCTGAQQTITTCGFGSEYSLVTVTAGNTYVFGSAFTTDNITIADESGATAYVHGTGQAVFVATVAETIRFYTHAPGCVADAACRTKWVTCSDVAPTPDGGVWYTFTADAANLTEIYTCGSVLDTRLHIYEAPDGTCAQFNCVSQMDNSLAIVEESFDGCGFFDQDDAYVSFVTTAGATYYIYVGADGSTNGSYQIAMDCALAVYGCMVPVACNYNPNANIEDNTCEYTSCACANNPGGFPLIISMNDTFGDGWENTSGGPGGYSITTGDGTVVASGAIDDAIYIVDEDNYEGAEFGLDVLCLDPACYIFTFTGAAIFFDEQTWSVSNGTTTLFSGAPAGNNAVATTPFVLGTAICGCTDPIACNYDATATDENGTCEYTTCAGCTNQTACNFDANASIDNGSCCFDNCITLTMNDSFGDGWQGCVVSVKTLDGTTIFSGGLSNGGYPNNASGIALGCIEAGCYIISSSDDSWDAEVSWTLNGIFGGAVSGSSNFPATYISIGGDNCTEGCTVQCACNYDPTAIIPMDDACTFDNCSGCTYADASNYNATASADDGSCLFDIANPCPADLNEDGTVTTADLLLFLGAFGSICPN